MTHRRRRLITLLVWPCSPRLRFSGMVGITISNLLFLPAAPASAAAAGGADRRPACLRAGRPRGTRPPSSSAQSARLWRRATQLRARRARRQLGRRHGRHCSCGAGGDAAAARDRRKALPAGWAGKNWACHQLSQAAHGEILLFTDADTVWAPGGLGRAGRRDGRATAPTCRPSGRRRSPRPGPSGSPCPIWRWSSWAICPSCRPTSTRSAAFARRERPGHGIPPRRLRADRRPRRGAGRSGGGRQAGAADQGREAAAAHGRRQPPRLVPDVHGLAGGAERVREEPCRRLRVGRLACSCRSYFTWSCSCCPGCGCCSAGSARRAYPSRSVRSRSRCRVGRCGPPLLTAAGMAIRGVTAWFTRQRVTRRAADARHGARDDLAISLLACWWQVRYGGPVWKGRLVEGDMSNAAKHGCRGDRRGDRWAERGHPARPRQGCA